MASSPLVIDHPTTLPDDGPLATVPGRKTRVGRSERRAEALLLVGLALLALLARWPNFDLIPAFTDETNDLRDGLLVTQGALFPLTGGSTYIGALWIWLVALALQLGAFAPSAPRLLVLAFGVATVLATYLLGRSWGGRLGGALAGALLATAAGHVLINSHVGWSNCITPLFTTLGAWALSRALAPPRGIWHRARGGSMLLAGLVWGLAFQTHPTTLALLPGAIAWLLWRGPALFRTRWPYLAAGLFLLVNLNLLLFNVSSGFDSVASADEQMDNYNDYAALTPRIFLKRTGDLLLNLFKLTGGAVDPRETDAAFLQDPALWLSNLLAVGGLVLLWRRGARLPALLVLSTILVLPLVNRKFDIVLSGRYYAPLLPVLFAATGALIAVALGAVSRAVAFPSAVRIAAWVTIIAASGFVVLHPLRYLSVRYDAEWQAGTTNALIFRTLQLVQEHSPGGELVLLDDALYQARLTSAAGRTASTLGVFLELEQVPFRSVDLESLELLDPRLRCRDQFVIMDLREADRRAKLQERLNLRGLENQPTTAQHERFGVYRLERLPEAPACA